MGNLADRAPSPARGTRRQNAAKTYRVEVSRGPGGGWGTCYLRECREWGNVFISFRDCAATVCSEDHALAGAVELVRCSLRRSAKRFRVETYSTRIETVETTLQTSEVVEIDSRSGFDPSAFTAHNCDGADCATCAQAMTAAVQ
jgi:hypothetical protein